MSSRDRTLLALVVLIIVAVGGYFVVVQPEHNKAKQLDTQISTQQTALSQAESQVQAGETAEAQYKGYAKRLKTIHAAVPDDAQVPQLIDQLQAAATHNHVGFQMVSASTATAAAPAATTTGTAAISFPSQAFSLQFTGGYFSVSDLLGALANYVRADDKRLKATGRLISITSVSLTPGAGTGSSRSGTVTASVSASDYDIPTALLSSGTSTTTPATTG